MSHRPDRRPAEATAGRAVPPPRAARRARLPRAVTSPPTAPLNRSKPSATPDACPDPGTRPPAPTPTCGRALGLARRRRHLAQPRVRLGHRRRSSPPAGPSTPTSSTTSPSSPTNADAPASPSPATHSRNGTATPCPRSSTACAPGSKSHCENGHQPWPAPAATPATPATPTAGGESRHTRQTLISRLQRSRDGRGDPAPAEGD